MIEALQFFFWFFVASFAIPGLFILLFDRI
jgi:hypothetical protein